MRLVSGELLNAFWPSLRAWEIESALEGTLAGQETAVKVEEGMTSIIEAAPNLTKSQFLRIISSKLAKLHEDWIDTS